MGLSKSHLRFLAIEHQRKPFRGKVLTLGRQCVYATFDEVLGILSELNIEAVKPPIALEPRTNIPSWKNTPNERYTSDVGFFQSLGLTSIQALDVDGFEGAEIIWDLNVPVGGDLSSRFDLVLDSGTIEHVFDVRTAMTNVARMLRPGGRIVHMTPANNFCNHGFFQFSPTCFADFYCVNQFQDLRVFVAEETLRCDETQSLNLFELDLQNQPCLMTSNSNRRLLVISVAEKGTESTEDRVPTQSHYSALFAATAAGNPAVEAAPQRPASRLAKRLLPRSLYTALRSGWDTARRKAFGNGNTRKPWGLKHWRKL